MSVISKATNYIVNSKPARFISDPFAVGAAAATLTLVSTTSKDAVNCYYYVTQSLKNEKIPEEKRKFVASLDLSNGILNIITQLALGVPVAKSIDKIFDKHIAPKHFDNNSLIQNLKKSVDEDIFESCLKKNKKAAKAGLGALATLFVTQIVAKRIIVPFIATPMASVIKKKMEQKEAKAAQTPSAPTVTANATESTPECFKSFK